MIWLVGVGCFLGGAALGAVLFKLLISDEARVKALELKLQTLNEEHESYKSSVHGHFSNSAQLLNKLTDSYRDVYLHMAEGARALCPDYISSQITSDTRALLDRDRKEVSFANTPVPPLDYAARTTPDRKSVLAEDYGFDKLPD